MDIIKSHIEWNKGWGNAPRLVLTVKGQATLDNNKPIWNLQPDGIVWATEGDIVNFIYMGNGMVPEDQARGFGGALMTRRLTNGCTITSNDAWSSNSSHVPYPCVEVTINGTASAITIARFCEIVYGLGAYVITDDGMFPTISSHPTEIRKAA